MSTKSRNYTLILLLAICILIIIGRYAQKPAVIPESSLALSEKRPGEIATSTLGPTPEQIAQQAEEKRMSECVAALRVQVNAEKIEYAPGTVLVGFKNSVDFTQAQVILSGYRLDIESEEESRESYPLNRILTAKVPKGGEIEMACLLRGNSGVRYAGLNTMFALHE